MGGQWDRVVNTGIAGAALVAVERGIFRWSNSAAADEITTVSIGDACFIVDDQTVAKTSNGGTRSAAGLVVDVDDAGVWVDTGYQMIAAAAGGLVAANNLSDLPSAATARANLGVNSRTGSLTTALPIGAASDTVNTIAVSLAECSGELLSGSAADLAALNTLSYLDGELVAYQTATLTGANAYGLTTLARGVYGTPITAHGPGSRFARLDSTVFKYPFTADRIGGVVYLKFQSYNIYGIGAQDISSLEPVTWTLRGSALAYDPPDVTGLATAMVGGHSQLYWTAVADPRAVDYEVRCGTAWATAQVLGRAAETHAPMMGDGTYWVAAHYAVPNGPDLYSQNPAQLVVSGSILVDNVVAVRDQSAGGWGGAFANTCLSGGNLTLMPAGNVLAADDVLTIADLNTYGGVAGTGSYQIPVTDRVDIGRVAPCNVIIKLVNAAAYNVGAVDITKVADIAALTDVLGIALGDEATISAQVRVSQDGATWGAWQVWRPGTYVGRAFDCRVVLTSRDPNVVIQIGNLVFSVDVPDRLDHYTGLVTDAVTGLVTLTFAPDGAATPAPFIGGPGSSPMPFVSVGVAGMQPGDDPVQQVSISLSQVVLKTTAGGAPASRTLSSVLACLSG